MNFLIRSCCKHSSFCIFPYNAYKYSPDLGDANDDDHDDDDDDGDDDDGTRWYSNLQLHRWLLDILLEGPAVCYVGHFSSVSGSWYLVGGS